MISTVWKYGIIVLFFILSGCVNETLPTLHPILSFKVKRKGDASQLILKTTSAKEYTQYKVVDAICTLQVSYRALINGVDSLVMNKVPIANESEAIQAGTFQGKWDIPDSLFVYQPIQIFGCVADEGEHDACTSLMLYADSSQYK